MNVWKKVDICDILLSNETSTAPFNPVTPKSDEL